MAVFALTDVAVTLNGTDISTMLAQVSIELSADEIETTSFGKSWRSRTGGLKDASLTLSFHQDFGAGAVDALVYPLFNTIGTVVIKPTSGSVSSTNPSYSGTFHVSQYSPISGSVGDLATFDVTWQSAGTVTRATA